MRVRSWLLAAFSVCALSGPAAADVAMYQQVKSGSMPSVPAITDPNFQADVLKAHNDERRLVGVGDLVWSPALAAEAKQWADTIAPYGRIQHANQGKHGENIWLNTKDRRTVGSMIAGWAIERAMYIPGGRHPNISTTGNWHDVGHYTQMVWAATTEVGCAIGRGPEKDILVCRYNPIGNFRGQMAFDPRNMPSTALAASGRKPNVSASLD